MLEDENSPESTRDGSAEDFLFHLYRGSELLQDDRVHEAKQELEQALSLQPRDAKGQDLLAIVYFRLGLYPRAISIFEGLIAQHPDATTPRINLALCYLKTGQPARARTELEQVIRTDPSHSRAWGYLGLSFQRMGDVERAVAAFQAGGHHQMARRLLPSPQPQAASNRQLSDGERETLSRVGGEAFVELERAQPFRTEIGSLSSARVSGTWAATEPGRSVPGELRQSVPPSEDDSVLIQAARLDVSRTVTPEAADQEIPSLRESRRAGELLDSRPPLTASPNSGVPQSPTARSRPLDEQRSSAPPQPALEFAREQLLVFPRDHSTSLHASGCVLIQGTGELAVRFDSVRAMSFARGVTTKPLPKKLRGRDGEEPLGSVASPLMMVEGAGQFVLGPPAGTRLTPVKLSGEPLCIREAALIALDGAVVYENARLPGGDGDFVSMVQLRGTGTVTLALPIQTVSFELGEERTVSVRIHSVLGWTGKIVPRAVLPSESPAKTRGLVALSGEGMVLVDGR